MATSKKSSTKKSPRTPKKESLNDYVKDIAEFEKFLLCVLNMGFCDCRETEEFQKYLKACALDEDFKPTEELEDELSRAQSFFQFPEYGYLDGYNLERPIANLTDAYSNRMYRKQIRDLAVAMGGPMDLYLQQRGMYGEAPELYSLLIELEGKYPDFCGGFIPNFLLNP